MDLVGTKIGGYIIDGLLSDAGGMGSVWRAHHEQRSKVLAVVKVIRPEIARPELVERFIKEAVVGMEVRHPRLVQIYDVAKLGDGRPYILMEYLDGGDLERCLQTYSKLSADDTLRVIGQICDGLEALHGAGIVHRDLKPSNVFLLGGEALIVKIVDFGLAKAPGPGPRLTHAGMVAGSPYYIAPEQVADFAATDSRADVYALSMIAIRMLTGRLPYEEPADAGSSAAQMILAALHRQRETPWRVRQLLEQHAAPDVPHEWFDILERGVAYHVDARIQQSRELALALAEKLSGGAGSLRDVAKDLYDRAAPNDATRKYIDGQIATGRPPPPAAPVTTTSGPTTHGAAAGAIETVRARSAPRRRRQLAIAAGAVVAAAAVAGVLVVHQLDRGADRGAASHVPVSTPTAPQLPPAATSPGPSTLQRLRIETDPPGAAITLDGEALGAAPIVAALPDGSTVHVRAELPGYEPIAKTLTVTSGTARLELHALVDVAVDAGAATVAPSTTTEPRPRRSRRRGASKPGPSTTPELAPAEPSPGKVSPPPAEEKKKNKRIDFTRGSGPR